MQGLKRIGLYGVSGIGKTTILLEVEKKNPDIIWLKGSKLILESANLSLKEFKSISDSKKYYFREKAIEKAMDIQLKSQKDVIIDGHLIFAKDDNTFENVMTKKDELFYTDYIYLKAPTNIILERIKKDSSRVRNYTEKTIENWIEYELNSLKQVCNKNNLPLYIIEAVNFQSTVDFISNYIQKR